MKKIILFFVFLFVSFQVQASLKFSPYIGADYSSEFGSNTKPMFGMEFSYEFDNGLEFGFGSYLSKTKVAASGDELRPNNFIDFSPEVKENPSYLILKYNYKINDKSKISPYGKLGKLNTSVYSNGYYNYDIKFEDETRREVDITKDETILYGNNFYSFGLQYTYNNYFLSVEYKIRLLEQEYAHSNATIDYNKTEGKGVITDSNYNYADRTFKASSISFLIGYTFDSKNRAAMDSDNQERRFRKDNIEQ